MIKVNARNVSWYQIYFNAALIFDAWQAALCRFDLLISSSTRRMPFR